MAAVADFRAGRLDWLVPQNDSIVHTLGLTTGARYTSGDGVNLSFDAEDYGAYVWANAKDAKAGAEPLLTFDITKPDDGLLRLAADGGDALPDGLRSASTDPVWALILYPGTHNQRTRCWGTFQIDFGVLVT